MSRLSTAWVLVIVLMPVAMLNYLDRQMLASMQASVMADIPTIETQANWGFMLGQFKWVYAVFSLIGGYIADRFSRPLAVCGSLFVWSAVTWWTGQVTTYSELLWARSLMGVSEAFYIPAALAMIADHHAGTTRSRAVGLHQMAIYLGVIAGGFGGYVAASPHLGWRIAFSACGVFGMVYAVPLVIYLRRTSSLAKRPPQIPESSQRGASPWSAATELLGNGSFVLLVLYFTLPAMAAWIVRDWMPSILKKEFGIGQGKAGVAATLYWQVAAIVGVVVGGYCADRWMQVHRRGRIFISAMGVGLIVPAILGVGFSSSLGMAIVFLIIFGLGWGLFDGNNMPILSQIVRPELRATGYGIMNFVSISCGGLADWGFGVLRDQQVPLAAICSLFATIALVSIAMVLLIRPRFDVPKP